MRTGFVPRESWSTVWEWAQLLHLGTGMGTGVGSCEQVAARTLDGRNECLLCAPFSPSHFGPSWVVCGPAPVRAFIHCGPWASNLELL
jgi:hypothetical protein